jgi:hypothetical protein
VYIFKAVISTSTISNFQMTLTQRPSGLYDRLARKDYSITQNTVVYQKLFAAEFIVQVDFVNWPDGSVIRDLESEFRVICVEVNWRVTSVAFRPEFS